MLRVPITLLALAVTSQPGTDEGLITVAEQSGYTATARHADVVALGRRLAGSSRAVQLGELGRTVEGRSIPLWIIADPPVATPREAAASGKLVVLLVGNIHAGEVDGKEALPMLARELVARPRHPLLDHLVVAMVPIYNADGNERVSPDNRPGQVGPERGMGQRPNAQGLDLNRDFMKLEAPETRALVRFLNEWDPGLVVDTHTTNGSRHRYAITYEGPKNPAGDRRLVEYARREMLPEIGRAFEARTSLRAFFYGNFDRDHARWTSFPALPRFGTTYVGLRNRLSILSEAYAYIPYRTRVLATRDYVRACLEHAAGRRVQIRRLLSGARDATIAAGRAPGPADLVAVRSEAHAFPEPATVLGFEGDARHREGDAEGVPKDCRVELVQDFRPVESVRRPFAYLVPPRHASAIETLRRHGIALSTLREDARLEVEAYRVDSLIRPPEATEGHRTVELGVTASRGPRHVPAGTVLVPTAQPLGTLAVYLLEPRSDDGLFTWNVFDDSLAIGAEVPVFRLPDPAAPAVDPLAPLPDASARKAVH